MPDRFNTWPDKCAPKDSEYIEQVYERVVDLEPYSYLFIDLKKETLDIMRLA